MSVTQEAARDELLARELAAAGVEGVRALVVLGSGLGGFADELEAPRVVPFEALASMPRSSVPGHAGRFVAGELGGVRILVQQGRVHLYEGRGVREVTRSVRAAARLGARSLVLTNAAGGLVPSWTPPRLMRIEDHLNLSGEAPLARAEAGRGCPYDVPAGAQLDALAVELGITLERGVYVGLPGPSYETPAEVRMLAAMGAHAVGMSTVCEAQVGHALGLAVVGISCISNLGAGLSATALDHDEVLEAGQAIAADFIRLLSAGVPRIVATAC